MTNFTGTPGNDTRTGTIGDDTFDMSQGGDDIVSALDGNDVISMGGKLTALDSLDGGAGNDTVILSGKYNNQVVFGAATMVNVETLSVTAGFNYNIKTADATVAAGATLTIDSSAMTTGKFTFDGSLETNGKFIFTGGSGADNFTDGAGDDVISTGAGNDKANIGGGGNDVVNLGDGNDEVIVKGALTATDQIDGGAGNDSVTLNGNYSAGLVFGATTMINVEALRLRAGHNYNLTLDDGNAATNLAVDASELGAANSLVLNGTAETTAVLALTGGAGNDTLLGGAAGNRFYLTLGGDDTATGGAGNDRFYLGSTLTAADTIDGGAGTSDMVELNGDYSLVLGDSTLQNIETLLLDAGHDYSITTKDNTVHPGQLMFINGSALGSTDTLTFDGTVELNNHSRYSVTGGAGDDVISLGRGDDIIDLSKGGADTVHAGDGDDTITMGPTAQLTAADVIDGGAGHNDHFLLGGDYSAGLVLSMVTNVEEIDLTAGYAYSLTAADTPTGASGWPMTINGAGATVLNFNGSAAAYGDFFIIFGNGAITGGDGSDTITGNGTFNGGKGNDVLTGNGTLNGGDGGDHLTGSGTLNGGIDPDTLEGTGTTGAGDLLTGGSGADIFVYSSIAESTSTAYDTITDFQSGVDKIRVGVGVSSFATAVNHSVSAATFDSDMAAVAVNLHRHEAMLFTVTSGDLAGHEFLFIGFDGVVGYQAGKDMVIALSNGASMVVSDIQTG